MWVQGTLWTSLNVFQAFHSKKNEYVVKDKPWGKKVKENTWAESLAVFFTDGENVRKEVVRAFLDKVKRTKVGLGGLMTLCQGIL